MASAPLNWLLKIGGATLKTTAKTLSEAVNTLHDSVTNLGTTVTNLGTTVTNLGTTVTNLDTSKADASATTTALNNLETSKLNISDLLSLEEIEASTSLTGKGVTAESIKALNSSLTADNAQQFQFAYDSESGKYGYKAKVEGADTFFPFKDIPTGFSFSMKVVNDLDGYYFYNNKKFESVKISFSSSNTSAYVNLYKDSVLYGTYKYNSGSITLDISNVDTLKFAGNQLLVVLEF